MEVGTRFKALRSTNSGDVTIGKVYTIDGLDDEGDPYFLDDVGDHNFAVCANGNLEHHGYEVLS